MVPFQRGPPEIAVGPRGGSGPQPSDQHQVFAAGVRINAERRESYGVESHQTDSAMVLRSAASQQGTVDGTVFVFARFSFRK